MQFKEKALNIFYLREVRPVDFNSRGVVTDIEKKEGLGIAGISRATFGL